MRLTGSMLRRLIAEEIDRSLMTSLIREAEDEEKADSGGDKGADEDAADALFGADEGGEDTGDDAPADDAGGDEAAPDAGEDTGEDADADAGDEEEKPAEEEKSEKKEDEKPPEPTGPAGFEFDEEINRAMMGFEEKALQMGVAKGEVESVVGVRTEGRIPSLAYLLFEAGEDEVQFDVPTFADDVARLISNYDTLIDMEQAIFTKATEFLEQKYGKDAAKEMQDILSREYQLEFEDSDPEASEREVYAVGSTSSASA